jgi:hypothetical protein
MPEALSYHIVTFEWGSCMLDGRKVPAVRVKDGVDHIDNVTGFYREKI